METVYLDHNATSPLSARSRDRWLEVQSGAWAHASSLHGPGVLARRVLGESRELLARALGAAPSNVIITSGATESNRSALYGLTRLLSTERPARWAVGGGEHPSVTAALGALEVEGLIHVRRLALQPTGEVKLDDLEAALQECDALCLQVANHETGVVTDLDAVGQRVLDAGRLWHADAAQALGRMPFSFESSGAGAITSASLSAHKLGGPKGIGILLKRGASSPLLLGVDPNADRAGTPDVAGVAAMAVALTEVLERLQEGVMDRVRARREALEASLMERHPGARVHGAGAHRLANTLSISIPTASGAWPDGEELVLDLAAAGVACSTGAACANGTGEPSPVLLAMGVPPEVAAASLRLSLGADTSEEELAGALRAIERALCELY